MSGDGCPCKGCPRGWYEWEQARQSRKGAEKSKRHGWTDAADSVLIEAAEKRRRKR